MVLTLIFYSSLVVRLSTTISTQPAGASEDLLHAYPTQPIRTSTGPLKDEKEIGKKNVNPIYIMYDRIDKRKIQVGPIFGIYI